MKTMTTAEFAKANLAAIEEPVEIRRYTKVVGVFHPGEPANGADQVEALRLELDAPKDKVGALRERVTELEDEVKRLKRELAARPPESVGSIGKSISPTGIRARSDDPFAGLAAQDRAFFERKLGTKKK